MQVAESLMKSLFTFGDGFDKSDPQEISKSNEELVQFSCYTTLTQNYIT
ncbi:hypothetical protein SBF1_430014 [Candidatus Desulfosporosinus infrequens]|uniref:Uncharacterized protein n=1 Tax=Candidatus Desulfosporosinus infrequens TaxID=2043169 RepID=A0A2U3LAX9_9FIRM|nr:hypothetical protein SBF1_430014 [Candidatus Desulfosporosinus infrequens]